LILKLTLCRLLDNYH